MKILQARLDFFVLVLMLIRLRVLASVELLQLHSGGFSRDDIYRVAQFSL